MCSVEHDTPFKLCPEHRIKAHEAQRKHRYGLSPEKYAELLESDSYSCAVCGKSADEAILNIDHDHSCCAGRRSCGKCVRGILCSDCNKFIAFAQESTTLLSRAIDYLKTRSIKL